MSVNASCNGYRPVPEFHPGPVKEPVPIEGTPLTRIWEARPIRGPSAPIALAGDRAYMGGSDRRVVAVDLATGKNVWSHRIPGPLVGGVVVRDSVVYAASDRPGGDLHAFQTISGNQLWATGVGYVEAPIALVGERIIAVNRQGQAVAVDRSTGKVAWRRRVPSQRVGPLPLPGDRVLISSYDSLYVLRVNDGTVLLRRRAPGSVTSEWRVVGQSLVANTGDSLVVALDLDSLSLQWQARLDAPALTAPAVRGDTVYTVTQTGSLYRIVAQEPVVAVPLRTAVWAATGAPTIFDRWLLVGASDGGLRAFNLLDGSEAWRTRLGRPFELAPVVLDDTTFLALGGRGDLSRMRR